MRIISIEGVEKHPYIESLEVTIHSAWKIELQPLITLVGPFRSFPHRLQQIKSQRCYYLDCVLLAMRFSIDNPCGNGWKILGVLILLILRESTQTILLYVQIRNWHLRTFSCLLSSRNKPKFLISWSIDFSPEGVVRSSIQPFFTMTSSTSSSR